MRHSGGHVIAVCRTTCLGKQENGMKGCPVSTFKKLAKYEKGK
jgi:hypothetical protein